MGKLAPNLVQGLLIQLKKQDQRGNIILHITGQQETNKNKSWHGKGEEAADDKLNSLPLQTVDFMEISCWESKNEAAVSLQKMVRITKSHLNKEDGFSF